MDFQTVFDVVADHLLTQRAQCIDPNVDGCAYRDGNGMACAVGALIEDDVYEEVSHQIEGGGVHGKPLIKALRRSGWDVPLESDPDFVPEDMAKAPEILIFNKETNFLDKLQEIHDGYQPEQWEAKLWTFAGMYDLDPDVLVHHKQEEVA